MNQRYYSLDVFRGATVCLMILVNNPGSWSFIYDPLEHAPWHGATPTDMVFPFFLFAVGNAMAFVLPKLKAQGEASFWRKIIKRTLIIFAIGLFLNWWPFMSWKGDDLVFRSWVNAEDPTKGVRVMGVLQRIALCYFFAAIIAYYFKPKKALYISIGILLFYWLLCYIGNPVDPYSLKGWFGTEYDLKILGKAHIYKGEKIPFDPEGLLSTFAAVVQVVLGYLVGSYILKKGKTFEMVSGLFVAGVIVTAVGLIWHLVFPINKKIWTSSYTLYTTGLAILTITTLIYFVEFKNKQNGLFKFFNVFGKNALFVFALSAFLPKGLNLIKLGDGVTPWNWLYKKVLIHTPGVKENGSLLYAICVITFMWAICYWMDKKKIYVKV